MTCAAPDTGAPRTRVSRASIASQQLCVFAADRCVFQGTANVRFSRRRRPILECRRQVGKIAAAFPLLGNIVGRP